MELCHSYGVLARMKVFVSLIRIPTLQRGNAVVTLQRHGALEHSRLVPMQDCGNKIFAIRESERLRLFYYYVVLKCILLFPMHYYGSPKIIINIRKIHVQ